ncbi:MAG: sugar MFS transporter [Saprospiraceae bacterium]|nr:sugar MFS transporter [Saprospiraceae bacterium]MDW8484378.1 sugar MFS transporter [Saprospiraceae bacterium]
MQNDAIRPTTSYGFQIALIGLLFFIFGFVTWLNGSLIPFLKLACDLKYEWQALLVTSAFYLSYFFLALPSSAILSYTGLKAGMALGLLVMAVGCLVFIPAAYTRTYGLFLTGLFVQGMGLAVLQTAANPYVSILGPLESAAQRISIMGICNKVAGILSPIILSSIVLRGAKEIEMRVNTAVDAVQRAQLLDALAERAIPPYIAMAAALGLLALFIRWSPLPDIHPEQEASVDSSRADVRTLWQFPHVWLGAIAIFFYVGAEVMAGDGIVLYGRFLGFELDQTKYFTALTLSGMLVGYMLSIVLIPRYVSQEAFLRYSAVLGIGLSAAAYFTSGATALTCVAMLGVANAVMWPAIFPLAIRGLGRLTQLGSALLIMGIVGGALLPQLYGLLAELPGAGPRTALQAVLLPAYFYILYYGWRGYKVGIVGR